jgi:ribosomal protein L7Ae-like RNA K-turn-binding protein
MTAARTPKEKVNPQREPRDHRQAMDDMTRQRIMRLIGLGVRGRGAVVGVEQVREAAKRNKVAIAIVATDASTNSLDKIVPLLNARRVRFVEVPSAAELGAAVGREQTVVVGIVDRQLAKGIREAAVKVEESARRTGTQEDV